MRILAFTKYGSLAASTRQRFTQYEPALRSAGFSVDYAPLFSDDHVQRLVDGRRASIPGTAIAYLRRIVALIGARNYDILWVHCELFPFLPPFMERLVKLWGKDVVFDYDDAIFHMYDASPNALVRRYLGKRLAPLLRAASACCCGNEYLRDYAARYCDRTMVLPTIVDTARYRPRAAEERKGGDALTIGWIGSPSTWVNVRPLLPMLEGLARERGLRIRVIGAGVAADRDRSDVIDLVDWTEEREIAEVQAMDIGIMPLLDMPFQRGKSGYKIVQYMACGAPVVASPVGVNATIVEEGATGYLATSVEEWEAALRRLIDDPDLRRRMGAAGRARAVEQYSLASQAPRLVALFRSVAGERD